MPKYAASVPESVFTPGKVETKVLGDLEFFDGLPNEETTGKLYSFLDVSPEGYGSGGEPRRRSKGKLTVVVAHASVRKKPTLWRKK
jgi:hypothetical protein